MRREADAPDGWALRQRIERGSACKRTFAEGFTVGLWARVLYLSSGS
jgi:hypothetical protein